MGGKNEWEGARWAKDKHPTAASATYFEAYLLNRPLVFT